MANIQTTAKQLRAGIAVAATRSTICWEPTGHLSVQLYDASGTTPLAGCPVRVAIPDEGTLSLEADARGAIAHPDVPFQDYELDLGARGKVTVPAVAARHEQHRCAVPGAKLGWVDLVIVDDRGLPVDDGEVALAGEALVRGDAPGHARRATPLDAAGQPTLTVGAVAVEVALPILPVATIVRLPKRAGP